MKRLLACALFMSLSVPATAQEGLKPFFGSLHDHTSQSGDDGQATVADALAAGRAAGFQFMGISPHNHMISPQAYTEFAAQMAKAEVPGEFLPFAAFEWGSISKGGHVGVVGAKAMITAENTDWNGFWRGVDAEAGALIVLNHPVWGHTYGGTPDATRIARARLMEVLGGPGEYKGADYQGRGEFSHREFVISQNDGWRCGVVYGEDNHSGRWGHVNHTRTGVWARELSRAALDEAFRARRTFVTEDPAMTVWIEADGTPMGGERAAGPVTLTVKVTHASQAITEVALYVDPDGPGGQLAEEVQRFTSGSFTTPVKTSAPGAWAMVVAKDASGDLAWSSPIFFGSGAAQAANQNSAVGKVDLNFASPADLDAVDGVGRGLVKAIQDARRTGTIFLATADLAKVPGFTPELIARIGGQFTISNPEETIAAIAQSVRDEHSLVATAARQTVAHYQAERGARLLALELAPLARAGDGARVKAVLALLDLPGREALRQDVLQSVKKAALDDGWSTELEQALK